MHHDTKTLRGRPACAGSGLPLNTIHGVKTCPVCQRTYLGVAGMWSDSPSISTHLHPSDMARAKTPVSVSRPAVEKVEIEVTPETHEAIRTFIHSSSKETFAAMRQAIPNGFNYVGYARSQGWQQEGR